MNMDTFAFARSFGLFFVTAVAELVCCYLPLQWLTGRGPAWSDYLGVALALIGAGVIALGHRAA